MSFKVYNLSDVTSLRQSLVASFDTLGEAKAMAIALGAITMVEPLPGRFEFLTKSGRELQIDTHEWATSSALTIAELMHKTGALL